MMGAPIHSSRQFRFAALEIILLTVAIRLPSLSHPQPIDSEAMYSVVANEIVDGEMLMNLPIICAWAIALLRSSSRLRPELFLAGALLGVAFLLKQPAAIAAVPLGTYLLLPSYRASRSLTPMHSIIQAATLTAGFFAALGLVTIVLWKQGILHDAFYWTIADHDVPHVFWQKGIVNTLTFLGVCSSLVIGAILACR